MYDNLRAKGGIFRSGGPHIPFQDLKSRAYNDGSLGQTELDLTEQMRRLTLVVGLVGLLVSGILFNQILQQSKRA